MRLGSSDFCSLLTGYTASVPWSLTQFKCRPKSLLLKFIALNTAQQRQENFNGDLRIIAKGSLQLNVIQWII